MPPPKPQPQSFSIWWYQPFKSLYLAAVAAILLVKLPWILLKNVPRSGRPFAKWTYKRAVIISIMRAFPSVSKKLKLRSGKDLSKEQPLGKYKKSAEFVWIPGLAQEMVAGEVKRLAEINDVKPMVRSPGYWIWKDEHAKKESGGKLEAKDEEKVVIHFHGGAYYIGSAHPSDICTNIPLGLLQSSSCPPNLKRAFNVEYRLTATYPFEPENPWPAQIMDALAGYLYVLSVGIAPENVYLSGDSAGGHLVLALTRYIRDLGTEKVPMPGGCLLWSAWTDPSETAEGPGSSNYDNAPTDIFGSVPGERTGGYSAWSLLGKLPWSEVETNPYFSSGNPSLPSDKVTGLFSDFPRTFISVGGLEQLLDHSLSVNKRLEADGVTVKKEVAEEATHDFAVFGFYEPERSQHLGMVAAWIGEGTKA